MKGNCLSHTHGRTYEGDSERVLACEGGSNGEDRVEARENSAIQHNLPDARVHRQAREVVPKCV